MTSCDSVSESISYDNNPYICSGETFWTIWDSLGDSNDWQPFFAEKTGTSFYSELNHRNLSYGGTSSCPNIPNGSQGRCLKLIEYSNKYPIDVVFLENVNDVQYVTEECDKLGSIDDNSFMISQKITVHHGALEKLEDAKLYIQDMKVILNDIPVERRISGTVLSIPYYEKENRGLRIKVMTEAKKSGNLLVMIGNSSICIPIKEKMTVDDIITALAGGGYNPGWKIVNNGDSTLTLSYYTYSDIPLYVDAKETGIIIETSESFSSNEYCYYYLGESYDGWFEINNWTDNLSLYSVYKGMFSFLKNKLPNTRLYWVLPTYFCVNCEDETINGEDNWNKLKSIQKEVCAQYRIPVIDLAEYCNITMENWSNYYFCNNIHPKETGYRLWADVLSQLLSGPYEK